MTAMRTPEAGSSRKMDPTQSHSGPASDNRSSLDARRHDPQPRTIGAMPRRHPCIFRR